MRKLWGRTSSSNVMKVLWTMEELGLSYERIEPHGPGADPAGR
jgi:glutathione S-transferase